MRFISLTIILLSIFTLISCSNDDDGSAPETNLKVYDLVAVRGTKALRIDYNGDGKISDNLMEEIDCYKGMVTLKDETELIFTTSGPENFIIGEDIECVTDTFTDTYSISGDELTFTFEVDGEEEEIIFQIKENQLILTVDYGFDPGMEAMVDFIYELR